MDYMKLNYLLIAYLKYMGDLLKNLPPLQSDTRESIYQYY